MYHPMRLINRLKGFFSKKSYFIDLVIILGFAIFAALAQFGRSYGYSPVVQLLGDTADICGYAAGFDHPEILAKDFFLGNPDNYRFYATIHVPLLRMLAPYAGGYGEAMIATHGVHVFLIFVGFYLLGIVLTKSRIWSLILALLSMVRIYDGSFFRWGYIADPIPRFTLQALIGFILAGAIYWRNCTKKWPFIMASMGAMMYIHPVGAPSMAFAIWCGYLSLRNEEWSWKKHSAVMLMNGGVFLLVAAPFIVMYMSGHEYGIDKDYGQIYEIMKYRLNEDFTSNIWGFIVSIPLRLVKSIVPFLGFCAFIAAFFIQKIDRKLLRFFSYWLLGLVFVSIIIPTIEWTLGQLINYKQVAKDLIRGTRFLIPMFTIIFIYVCAKIAWELTTIKRITISVFCLMLTLCWMMHNQVYQYIASPVRTLKVVTGITPKNEAFPDLHKELRETIVASKNYTPQGATFLSVSDQPINLSLTMRYSALKPQVYSRKDGGALLYSNHKAAMEWYLRAQLIEPLVKKPWDLEKCSQVVKLARLWRAEYLAIDFGGQTDFAVPGTSTIWSNDVYRIVKVDM